MSKMKWGGVFVLSTVALLAACQSDVLNVSSQSPKPTPVVQPAPAPTASEKTPEPFVDPYDKREKVPRMAMVLAFSWQPGFCENHEKKSECQSQTPDRYDATHFTLHGLWPQPRSKTYCGVSKADRSRDRASNWLDLPAIQISVKTKQRLDRIMPGTRSNLDRHEWIKHGTCYSKGAETYYRDSLALMDQINGSSVQRMFANNIGKELTSGQIRAAFDSAFGRGTGKRVRISCKRDGRRQLITEITLGLNGIIGPDPDIGRLASRSRVIKAGCPRGVVDAVGLQ